MHLVFKPHIVAKLWDKHGVIPEEVEEALQDPKRFVRRHRTGRGGAPRYIVVGKSGHDRILKVIIDIGYDELKGEKATEVVSALDAPSVE